MKKQPAATIIIALYTLSAFLFSSCHKIVGEGPVNTETRVVSSFTGIVLKVPGNLYYTEDATQKLELRAQQNILDEIETVVSGNNVEIRFKHHNTSIGKHDVINIYAASPAINNLEIKGSGNLYATLPIHPSSIRLAVDGSGNVQVNQLIAGNIDASISGSGNIIVNSGSSNSSQARISGSGYIDLLGMEAKTGRAEISGSGTIKLFLQQTLDAYISGSGTVLYKGSPIVNSSISGSGSVKKL
ncbi:MAG: head GIN domain-containing protein [Chitinophagaceae bacterium]